MAFLPPTILLQIKNFLKAPMLFVTRFFPKLKFKFGLRIVNELMVMSSQFSSSQCCLLSNEYRILTVNIVVKPGHTAVIKRKCVSV